MRGFRSVLTLAVVLPLGAVLMLASLQASPPVGVPLRPADSVRLETVFPRIAGKNHVRWWEFDWRWLDFRPVAGAAPVRLYFYQSARPVAELAKAFTAAAYREFVDRFAYKPTKTIPYLVYNSHFEFESTNAFFVSEHVLGVTSTVDLTMALPYWGEHKRFIHVMRHELAHQFTIQLVRDRAEESGCDALERYPLWFIEGLAQFYALGDITPEVRAALADRLLDRADSERGGLPRFFGDATPSFERIYLIGHAQVVFIEEVGGAGTVRKLLEAAPRMCAADPGDKPRLAYGFAEILGKHMGLDRKQIEQRWRDWVLERSGPRLEARHPLAVLEEVEGIAPGEIDSYVLSPDRKTIFYRVMNPQTARTGLYLQQLDDPDSRQLVAEDQRLGLVSLHPLGRRVMAIGKGLLAYVGRVSASDVLFVRTWHRQGQGRKGKYRIGAAVTHDLWRSHGIIEMGYPAVRPSDGAVAFVGLDHRAGFLDVFRIDQPLKRGSAVTRVTSDPYAERDLVYDDAGRLHLVSDATPDGNYQIFRHDGGGPVQLTRFAGPAEMSDPAFGPDGELLFSAALADVPQIQRLHQGVAETLTEAATAIGVPAVDADGDLLGLLTEVGRRYLVRLPAERWLQQPAHAQTYDEAPAWQLPREDIAIEGHQDYTGWDLRHYSMQDLILFGGTGPFLMGLISFTDLLKDHVGALQVQVLGDWERTNATLLFIDRGGRWGFGGTVFARSSLQLVPETVEQLAPEGYLLQRLGGSFLVEYPFGYHARLEAFVAPQVVRAFDFSNPETTLAEKYGEFRPALELGARFAVDTTRMVPFLGPTDGVSVVVDGSATQRLNDGLPFGTVSADLSGYRSVSRSNRVYFLLRLGGGLGFGGELKDQFYVEPSYNLRAYAQGSLEGSIGRYYYLSNLEFRVPLDFVLPVLSYVEGMAGLDFGSVFFDGSQAWKARVAAGVLGLHFGLGPIAIRLHFARPIDIGAPVPENQWLTHFTLLTPFLFF